ncbi:PD-(D/E)XK nuclease family protein [Aquicoccus porphyridii]|uniref:PDDEXK-like family protein n=1 Tax=Aquicoccus porphyridii TaxID=1852029 RepID=UPI00165D8AB8|nr:PD-(D/E)XK nuclease family protein [Aquicoccus porphyridii]
MKELTDLALSADFRELANAQDIYCPFESLRISRVEIRHSNFLANILNPLANHGFGECVLRNLLDKLLTASGDHALRLELALSDLGRIEVFREFHNMDVTIHLPDLTPSLVCIIELKVDAHEHSGQLQRYAENAANLWPNASRRFYLVSPTGMDASHDDWNTLSFSEIVAALKAAYAEPVGSPLAKSMLRAYIDLLRRLFVPDEKMEELARKLWQKHGQTLEYLIDQRPSPMRDISQAVQSEESIAGIIEGISQRTGIEIAKDSSSNTYLRFYIPAWEQDPDMPFGDFTASKSLLVIEAEFYGERIHVRFNLGRGDTSHRESLYERLKASKEVDMGNNKKLTPQWTRLASHTIRRIKNIEELPQEDQDKLVETARSGIVDFVARYLPAYDQAIMAL